MASPYADKVLADGAVAYWRLDEASGNALSQVGNFPGTVTGGVTRGQPGALSDGNAAMAFDGTGRVSAPVGAYSAWGTGPATLECWVKATGAAASLQYIIDTKDQYNNVVGLLLLIDAFGLRCRVANGTESVIVSWAFVPDSQWHHVVVRVARSTTDTLELYVDGVQQGTSNLPVTGWNITAANALGIASDSRGVSPANWFVGLLDEVAIYHTALTPQQIADHYALGTAPAMPAWHDLRYRYCRFVRAPGWRRSA